MITTANLVTLNHYKSFIFIRERESHSAHLKSIEAELDAQMAKVEQQALAKAKQEYDNEKRSLQSKMDAELTELQTQLRLFQKVIHLCLNF